MMITTAIAAMVATVGVIGGAATNIGAAEQWESEIVGLAEGEPFRVVADGEIAAVEIGSGFLPEYVGLITADGTELRTQEPSPTGWPVFRWDLAPGERIIELFGRADSPFGISSLGAYTSHGRLLSSFGAIDPVGIENPAGDSFYLAAPDGHAVVGLVGRSLGSESLGYPTGHLAAVGIVTEPIETPDLCEFTVTNGSDRPVLASAGSIFGDGIVTEFGELAPGVTGTFAMPSDFVPQAPALSIFTLEYVDVDGPPEWTSWTAGLEPCGSVLVFDPDLIDGPPPPDTTDPAAPTGLAAELDFFEDEVGGVVTYAYVTWNPSVDDRDAPVVLDRPRDIDPIEYDLLRNGVLVATTSALGLPVEIATGSSNWFQVVARDRAGNESVRTAPLRVDAPADDVEPPSTPQNLAVVLEPTGFASLTWDVSTDNIVVSEYQVLRNGVEIGVTSTPGFVTRPPGPGSSWYQVRARDAAGNESFKTPPVRLDVAPPDTNRPSAPQGLTGVVESWGDVTLSWEPSADDVGVVDYLFYENGALIGRGDAVVTSVTLPVLLPTGRSIWYQVSARDAAGNESARSAPVRVDVPQFDERAPSSPQGLAATVEANGDVMLTWEASTDDVGVAEYQVLRNGVEIGVTGELDFTVPTPAIGSHWYQVRARDAAGNESFKTAPVRVDIAPPDTQNPSAPTNLTATIGPEGDVILTWDASTDDVGVTEYGILRNGVDFGFTVTPDPMYLVTAPLPGSHWYQVVARDAAGNESRRTPPVRVDIE